MSLPRDLARALSQVTPPLGDFALMRHYGEVDSTNDLALALAAQGAPEGTSVLADQQRAGRGRRGRTWFSPPGAGLYLSIIVRPAGPPGGLPLVTLAAGVAAARALQAATGLDVELKWPNDLVIGRPWRKLGGVLCEATGSGAPVGAVVVGIGINLRSAAYPPELAARATSVEVELGRAVDRAPVAAALVAAVRDLVALLRQGAHEAIRDDWRRFGAAGLGGAPIRWLERDVVRHGRARDLDRDGALVVEIDGRLERLIAGEVTWEDLRR